jgi:hypothetical protein
MAAGVPVMAGLASAVSVVSVETSTHEVLASAAPGLYLIRILDPAVLRSRAANAPIVINSPRAYTAPEGVAHKHPVPVYATFTGQREVIDGCELIYVTTQPPRDGPAPWAVAPVVAPVAAPVAAPVPVAAVPPGAAVWVANSPPAPVVPPVVAAAFAGVPPVPPRAAAFPPVPPRAAAFPPVPPRAAAFPPVPEEALVRSLQDRIRIFNETLAIAPGTYDIRTPEYVVANARAAAVAGVPPVPPPTYGIRTPEYLAEVARAAAVAASAAPNEPPVRTSFEDRNRIRIFNAALELAARRDVMPELEYF